MRSQKVVKTYVNYNVFVKVRSSKYVKKRKLLDDRRSPTIVKKAVKYNVFVKATN